MLTKDQTAILKGVAILMMLCLHLFNTLDYKGLFVPLIFIGAKPLIYYISLFSDACVPLFCLVSGYGLYLKFLKSPKDYFKSNLARIKKLYINYWIILIIFVVIVGSLIGKEGYPGNITTFLLNVTAIDTSYNGAWWFFTIYILFLLSSSVWFKLIDKLNSCLYTLILLSLYFIAFYFRVYKTYLFDNYFLNLMQRQIALYFCTLFQFLIGAFLIKWDIITAVDAFFRKLKFKNIIICIIIVVLILIHGIVPNFIIAPFIAFVFILLFCQIHFPGYISGFLNIMGQHTLNIWLIHMFFYLIYFRSFMYSVTYVIPIFLLLLVLSLGSSFVIKYLNDKILKWL